MLELLHQVNKVMCLVYIFPTNSKSGNSKSDVRAKSNHPREWIQMAFKISAFSWKLAIRWLMTSSTFD